MGSVDTTALRTWALLNEALNEMGEHACWALLTAEKEGKRRARFMERIYGRANKLRSARERHELLRLAAAVPQ